MKKTIFFLLLFSTITTLAIAGPYAAISTYDQWDRVLHPIEGYNYIRPLRANEWLEYQKGWTSSEYIVEGEPYPETSFYELDMAMEDLRASRIGLGSEPPMEEPGPGLVMTWGSDQLEPGRYASAWVFAYGQDPDLSNKTIQITVFPPTWGQSGQITQVSFGMRDINNNIRSWYWNCGPNPGDLPSNVATQITIDTSMMGIGATNPPASSFMSAAAFDITQVVDFIVDENAVWVGGPTPIPPDGVNIGRIWNYWKDLMVLPKKPIANKGYYIKYSQPAVELADEPGWIYGWDEKSIYHPNERPIMADDFLCKDDRPITDFHWWGSFIGWNESTQPPILPEAFHIAIWTDIPDPDPDDPSNWSMPGKMVWEHKCTNWTWNFAGFDKHPEGIEQYKNEACFQFNQLLSEPDWFYQKPGENVYWLSIAAIYPDNIDEIKYPWGWKTRPHKFNDPAYRIFYAYNEDGTDIWPPKPKSMASPEGSWVIINQEWLWDLSFEISTNVPAYIDEPIPGDIDRNGIVNLLDFATLATNWLKTAP